MLAARFFRVSALLALVAVGLAACEADVSGAFGTRDFEQEPTGETSAELVSYSCATHTDTGYSNGKAFTITVMTVDGKPVERDTANAFLTMAKAADGAGIHLRINSGFRTNAEQKYLYNCYLTGKCNNGNLAASPGYSNHQSGHALDLNTGGGALGWLNAHGGAYGFKRTVPSESWHWEWWGGGPIQDFCPTCKDECQGNVLSRSSCQKTDCAAQGAVCLHDGGGLRCDALPRGSLDGADAEQISGWAQDPSAADKPIEAHVYIGGPAGAAGAVGRALKADRARADLCGAIGSCNHAFAMRTPRSLLDGAPHPVHVYGIDVSGAPNAQLGNSPRTLQVAPPAIPSTALLRRVPGDQAFSAWRFSAYEDVAPMPDDSAKIGAWRDKAAPAMPTAPELVQGDDGTSTLWLVDTGVRRRVVDAAEWRFGPAKTLRAAELYAIPQGAPLPERPLLVRDVGPVHYVLDVPFQPTGAAGEVLDPHGHGDVDFEGASGAGGRGSGPRIPGGSSGAAGQAGAAIDLAADPDASSGAEGSCTVRSAVASSGGQVWASGALLALAMLARGRRRR